MLPARAGWSSKAWLTKSLTAQSLPKRAQRPNRAKVAAGAGAVATTVAAVAAIVTAAGVVATTATVAAVAATTKVAKS